VDLPTGRVTSDDPLDREAVAAAVGPIGLLLYVLTDKEPASGTHEEFVRPLWKQGVGSTVHCVAGDATGIVAAAITATWSPRRTRFRRRARRPRC
jgi:hypothetical protein